MNCTSPHPSLRRRESEESAGQRSGKKLLFGEIDTSSCSSLSTGGRSRTNSSVCNVVDSKDRFFNRFWAEPECRNAFLSRVDRKTLPNLRLVCHDFGARAAPLLFEEISVTFKTSTFSRPTRLLALERIGHHVKTFKFNMPHVPETFLPPLIDDVTGEAKSFAYCPQIQKPETLIGKVKLPKYGTWEMTDMLIKQYPPLFHAATNIPSFIRALEALPTLSHLIVNCPDQEMRQCNRRSTVDYALISLRIAVERASLPLLSRLTFDHIHPGGLIYMHPILGLGSLPGMGKCWRQIKYLSLTVDAISVESMPAYSKGDRLEQLRVLHSYLSVFSPRVRQLYFQWAGGKGPCPLTLDLEQCLQSPSSFDGPSPKPSLSSLPPPTPPRMRKPHAMSSTPPPLQPARPRTPPVDFCPSPSLSPASDFSRSAKSRSSPRRSNSSRRPTAPRLPPLDTAVSPIHNPCSPPTPPSSSSSINSNGSAGSLSPSSNPSTANTTPLTFAPTLPAVHFPRLTHLTLQSLRTPASHLALIITRHARTLADFAFDSCHLTSGDWDEALEPLTVISGSSRWKGHEIEVWDVPLIIDGGTGVRSSVASSRGRRTPAPRGVRNRVVREAAEKVSGSPLRGGLIPTAEEVMPRETRGEGVRSRPTLLAVLPPTRIFEGEGFTGVPRPMSRAERPVMTISDEEGRKKGRLGRWFSRRRRDGMGSGIDGGLPPIKEEEMARRNWLGVLTWK